MEIADRIFMAITGTFFALLGAYGLLCVAAFASMDGSDPQGMAYWLHLLGGLFRACALPGTVVASAVVASGFALVVSSVLGGWRMPQRKPDHSSGNSRLNPWAVPVAVAVALVVIVSTYLVQGLRNDPSRLVSRLEASLSPFGGWSQVQFGSVVVEYRTGEMTTLRLRDNFGARKGGYTVVASRDGVIVNVSTSAGRVATTVQDSQGNFGLEVAEGEDRQGIRALVDEFVEAVRAVAR